jgi:hypothetical protein
MRSKVHAGREKDVANEAIAKKCEKVKGVWVKSGAEVRMTEDGKERKDVGVQARIGQCLALFHLFTF